MRNQSQEEGWVSEERKAALNQCKERCVRCLEIAA